MTITKDCELKGTIIQYKVGKNAYGKYFLCQVKIFNDLFKIIIDYDIFKRLQLKEKKQILVYQEENDRGKYWKFNKNDTIKLFERRLELERELKNN